MKKVKWKKCAKRLKNSFSNLDREIPMRVTSLLFYQLKGRLLVNIIFLYQLGISTKDIKFTQPGPQ